MIPTGNQDGDPVAPADRLLSGRVPRQRASQVAKAWVDWLATMPGPAAAVSFRPPAADVYLDAEIEGQRYQAFVVGTSLCMRSRRAFNSTARLSCTIGRAVIGAENNGPGRADAVWFLEDGSGQRLPLHLTEAGRRTFSITFGVPISITGAEFSLPPVDPVDYFCASTAFEALRSWACARRRQFFVLGDDTLLCTAMSITR